MTETIIFLMAEKIWEALYGPPKYKEKNRYAATSDRTQDFLTGSQVRPTPSFLNIFRSTSLSITVE